MRLSRRSLIAAGAAFAAVASMFVVPAAAADTTDGPTPFIVGGSPVGSNAEMRKYFPGIASFQLTHPTRNIPDWHSCTTTAIAPPKLRLDKRSALALGEEAIGEKLVAAAEALNEEVAKQSARLGGAATKWAWINAHCITWEDGTPWDPDALDLHIRIGSIDRTIGRVIDVAKVFPHQDWAWGAVPKAPVRDAGLVELTEWIRLPGRVAPWVGKPGPANTAGWGLLNETDADVPTRLHAVGGWAPFNLQQCSANPLPPSKDEICVESPVGQGACYGDSGGPVNKYFDGSWRVVGSVSRSGAGEGCGSGGEIATDVTAYDLWMLFVMALGRTPPATVNKPTGNLRAISPYDWRRAPSFTRPRG